MYARRVFVSRVMVWSGPPCLVEAFCWSFFWKTSIIEASERKYRHRPAKYQQGSEQNALDQVTNPSHVNHGLS